LLNNEQIHCSKGKGTTKPASPGSNACYVGLQIAGLFFLKALLYIAALWMKFCVDLATNHSL
jgi:hypothetical protein